MTTFDHTTSAEAQGCAEYAELSRRGFLTVAGVGALAASVPAWLPRVSFAKDYRGAQRDVIVSIYLRGASDGLTVCVPWGDPDYYTARPQLSIAQPDSGQPNRATNLDGFFGLPPAMTALIPAYQAGHLLFVHACGSTDPSRSHFEAQRFMETGKAQDPDLSTGWLGRHIASVPPMDPGAPLRGVAINAGLMRTLAGATSTLPIPDLDTFDLNGAGASRNRRRTNLDEVYQQVSDPLKAAAITTLETISTLATINFAGYAPTGGAVYPTGSFGTALKSAAALMKAEVGVEAIAIDVGGWDTHAGQGVITGTMAQLMTTLSQGLAALHADMHSGPVQPGYIAVAMSEFGRRVAENASLGTDHGHGNAMLVMGGAVTGGRVLSQWPGLAVPNRDQGRDLQVTIDYRDVLAEIVASRLGSTDLPFVFPDYTPTFRGVVA